MYEHIARDLQYEKSTMAGECQLTVDTLILTSPLPMAFYDLIMLLKVN